MTVETFYTNSKAVKRFGELAMSDFPEFKPDPSDLFENVLEQYSDMCFNAEHELNYVIVGKVEEQKLEEPKAM
jgi:hypothetical protein